MAEQEETPVEAGGAKKGLPVKLIVAVFGLLLLLGGAGLVLKSGIIGQLGGGEETEAAVKQEGAASDMGPIYPLETFIVNLADERG